MQHRGAPQALPQDLISRTHAIGVEGRGKDSTCDLTLIVPENMFFLFSLASDCDIQLGDRHTLARSRSRLRGGNADMFGMTSSALAGGAS